MSDKPAAPQTLAVFLLDDHDAARDFLKVVQGIDKADDKVTIVDAAIADRSKRRGSVKVHQTEDTGGLKGGLRGGAIGVVVGTILLGPAGPLVGGVVGGALAGLHNRFRDIGIDDRFMKQVAGEVEKGRSALFVLYQGDWSGSIGAISDAVKSRHALLIQSTLPAEAAAQLKALVEPAADELGGEEVVADFEVETEPEEAPATEPVAEPATPEAAADAAEPDDLTKLSGIGPKAAEVLVAAGIGSYARLAATSEPQLREVFSEAHVAAPHSIGTWSMQASFAEHGDWAGQKAFVKKARPEPTAAAVPAPAAAATAAPEVQAEPDDLTNLVGIGTKAAKALTAAGITTYEQLADASEPQLRSALHAQDMTAPRNVGTWPMQAAYAAKGDWRSLAKYNQKSAKGRSSAKPAAAPAATPAPAAKPDDLTQLHGVGPRIAAILADAGVTTYATLQETSPRQLHDIVAFAGALPPASLPTWPDQAAYAARGDWNGLAAYNKRNQ